MKRLVAHFFFIAYAGLACAAPEWLIAAREGRAVAGEPFELIVAAASGTALPDELELRIRSDGEARVVTLRALAPTLEGRRLYGATMPAEFAGPVTLELAERESSALVLMVTAGSGRYEPPLSEDEPMYFIVGARDGYSARFQLSFKYRLFDTSAGLGRGRPWLSGFYFGYTQNSLWDLSSDSKAFRDTSYRPSLFWKWERDDAAKLVDAVRMGLEHESNGRDGPRSRSINIAFVRPQWHKVFANGHELQFAPKFYRYLERDENPDIQNYRGYVDWRVRYDASAQWIASAMIRRGTLGKGSLLVDLSRRSRALRFGPVGGYFHFQYFTGYGEDILDYNVRRKSQLRAGFAIVP